MKLEQIKFWLRFFWHTWRSPNRYRRLFREISSCYLTPGAPGKATVAGFLTDCITSTPQMVMVLDGNAVFYIDREALIVRQAGHPDEELPLWDWRAGNLKAVLDSMIRFGVPYKMSDTNVTHTGL